MKAKINSVQEMHETKYLLMQHTWNTKTLIYDVTQIWTRIIVSFWSTALQT